MHGHNHHHLIHALTNRPAHSPTALPYALDWVRTHTPTRDTQVIYGDTWFISNILSLNHNIVVVGVRVAPVVDVATTVTQRADPTWRNDADRTATDPTWRTEAGRTVLCHDSGDTRRAPLCAPHVSRAPYASDASRAHP